MQLWSMLCATENRQNTFFRRRLGVATCPIVFPFAIPDSSRIAAGYLLRTDEFLAQTHLRAKSHERTSPLSTQQAECQETASQDQLNSKGL